jgi:hypothetical protein
MDLHESLRKSERKTPFGAALPLFYQTVTEVRTECMMQKAGACRIPDWRRGVGPVCA